MTLDKCYSDNEQNNDRKGPNINNNCFKPSFMSTYLDTCQAAAIKLVASKCFQDIRSVGTDVNAESWSKASKIDLYSDPLNRHNNVHTGGNHSS